MSAVLRVLCGGVLMTVVDYVASDLFIVRIVKYLLANPSNKWVNSYEFTAIADGDTTNFVTLTGSLVSFEAEIHSNLVAFDRVIVSTWQADSTPYDPTSFLTIPLTQIGQRSEIGIDMQPLGMAWRVNRVPVSGRNGNLFYRGALYENQVYSPAGTPVLSTPSASETILQDAITNNGVDSYLTSGTPADFLMSMIDATGSVVRSVTTLTSDGVSLIKQDHQWFNRTP